MKKPHVWIVEVKNRIDEDAEWHPRSRGIHYRTRKIAREWARRFELESCYNYQKQFGVVVKVMVYRATKYVRES